MSGGFFLSWYDRIGVCLKKYYASFLLGGAPGGTLRLSCVLRFVLQIILPPRRLRIGISPPRSGYYVLRDAILTQIICIR
nr:MAG TPA: hypothetical protein [Caudoviricetes sp.]